jgi:hypothetical protein
LAITLHKFPDEVIDGHTSSQLSDWIDRFSRQPWPWIRDDWRAANATALAGMAAGAKWKIRDCLLEFTDRKRRDESETDESAWDSWASVVNKRIDDSGI